MSLKVGGGESVCKTRTLALSRSDLRFSPRRKCMRIHVSALGVLSAFDKAHAALSGDQCAAKAGSGVWQG